MIIIRNDNDNNINNSYHDDENDNNNCSKLNSTTTTKAHTTTNNDGEDTNYNINDNTYSPLFLSKIRFANMHLATMTYKSRTCTYNNYAKQK